MGAIRAELARDSDYTCNGIAARTVAGLAAKLIEIGHDPGSRLDIFRGETLSLKVRSIGEAAALDVHDCNFSRRRQPPERRPSRRWRLGLWGCQPGGIAHHEARGAAWPISKQETRDERDSDCAQIRRD